METHGFELGSTLDLSPIEPLVVDAFVAQRCRQLAVARSLAADEWSSRTRCADWDAHQLLLHVLGATEACHDTLTGQRPVFGSGFDPNATPGVFVDRRAGEPVEVTLDDFDAQIASATAALRAASTRRPPARVTSIWGEQIDWRLFVAHFFYDGWIHERDLLVPLGRHPEVLDVEARLATAYALHLAAIVAGGFGLPLAVTLRLDGPGAGSYRVTADGFDVRVLVHELASDDGPVDGDAVTVTEAISARGPELASVLHAPPDVIEALSGVGAFLQA